MTGNFIIGLLFLLIQLLPVWSKYYFSDKSTTQQSYQYVEPDYETTTINGITLKEAYEYYKIEGITEEELQQQMNTLGPEDFENRVYAYASWGINWDYPYRKTRNGCELYEPIEVDVKVKYTLPEWNPPQNAPEPLISKWNYFMEKLTLHEKGHKDNALKNAEIIRREFQKFQTFPTCDEFLTAMDKIGFEYVDKTREDDKNYDEETGHGISQGAIFP